jgi:hypothetical protein
MKWRPIVGGVVGFALWYCLFFVVGVSVGLLWPDYREAARLMFREEDFRLFTTPMLFANFAVFAVAGLAAGCVATLLARSRTPALVLAVLLFIYAGLNHYVRVWDRLPDWYNLIVPLVIAGFVWIGGRVTTVRIDAGSSGTASNAA